MFSSKIGSALVKVGRRSSLGGSLQHAKSSIHMHQLRNGPNVREMDQAWNLVKNSFQIIGENAITLAGGANVQRFGEQTFYRVNVQTELLMDVLGISRAALARMNLTNIGVSKTCVTESEEGVTFSCIAPSSFDRADVIANMATDLGMLATLGKFGENVGQRARLSAAKEKVQAVHIETPFDAPRLPVP